MNSKPYWENIHLTKTPAQVSWYQDHPILSLQFITNTGIDKSAQIIDVGGGISTLVDDLLVNGYQNITVLDISAASLQTTQQRLGAQAQKVNWLEADITLVKLPYQSYHIWHDRAVFHFLTKPAHRQRYVETVRHALKPGGHIIVATFAPDGPTQCSGLDVVRYSEDGLHNEFGDGFEIVDSVRETHQTPFGTEQKFVYCYCRRN